MAEKILQSTSKLVVFRAYLSSDGVTPATGKTIAITISKNGAVSFANPSVGALNATEMASGFYKFTLSATDTNTIGPLAFRGAEGTIHDVGDVFHVEILTAVNVTQVAGQTANAAAAVTFPATVASTTNITGASGITLAAVTHTGAVIPTVSTLTTLPTIPANWLTAAGMAADASAEIADAVWDEVLSGHLTAGTTGNALNAAGAGGDPWTTTLPGAYGAGTAGNIIGNRIDAAITSRMASYTNPTGFLAATFPTTVASTTNITGGTITTVGTVNAIAANAVNASALAADAVTEIQSGLATASAVTAASIRSAVGLAAANLDTQLDNQPTNAELTTAINAGWTTALTESYAVNGVAFTAAQGLYAIHQYLMDLTITGTDYSVKKLDGSTAFSVTLNSPTDPTAATRA